MSQFKDIYTKLREARQQKGLTVNKLAEKMGEDHQKVGRIERGCRSLTIDYLIKVSKALDTPPEAFLEEPKSNVKERPFSETSSPLLNKIIVFIEEQTQNLFVSPQLKGDLVSRIYEFSKHSSPSNQHDFLEELFEVLAILFNHFQPKNSGY